MNSKALRLSLSALLVLALVPATAFADEAATAYEEESYLIPNDSEEDPAESWRFTDGYPSNYLREEMEKAGIALMGAFSDVEDGYRATWVNANGVLSYAYRKNATDKDTVINVPGAKEVGVDISYFNNEGKAIDWKKMKADGITFAIIRAGDGYTTTTGFYDPWFVKNIQGAKAAGLKVGVYIYSRATNTKASGKNSVGHEVNLVLDQMKNAGLGPEDLGLPVYFDMEDATQRALPKKTIGDVAESFCKQMIAKGYQVGIYANQDWFTSVLTDSRFSVATMKKNGWSRWVARYSWGSSSSGVDSTDIWQFTSIGTVAGTSRKYCDVNFSYVDFGAQPATYQVTYELNGGTLYAPNPVTFTGTLTLPTPTRSGYIFDGWYADAAFKTPVKTISQKNATVYAKWTTPYRVSYVLNGGKNHASNAATYVSTLTPKSPTRTNYQFDGWHLDAAFTTKVTKLTAAHATNKKVTVYAKWSQPYKVTYSLNRGKNNKANPAKFGGTLTLKAPTRSGYTFGGWYLDKKYKTKVTKLTSKNTKNNKVTVYARWYKNYKITYKLNGGKNSKSNPSKYGGTLTLKNPTRSGYVFKGWYTDKKFKKKVTKLSMTKNRTVYAKWTKLTGKYYRVTATGGLNIRKTASTKAAITGALDYNKKVLIKSTKSGWGKLSDGRGWIKLSYAKKV